MCRAAAPRSGGLKAFRPLLVVCAGRHALVCSWGQCAERMHQAAPWPERLVCMEGMARQGPKAHQSKGSTPGCFSSHMDAERSELHRRARPPGQKRTQMLLVDCYKRSTQDLCRAVACQPFMQRECSADGTHERMGASCLSTSITGTTVPGRVPNSSHSKRPALGTRASRPPIRLQGLAPPVQGLLPGGVVGGRVMVVDLPCVGGVVRCPAVGAGDGAALGHPHCIVVQRIEPRTEQASWCWEAATLLLLLLLLLLQEPEHAVLLGCNLSSHLGALESPLEGGQPRCGDGLDGPRRALQIQ